MSPARTGVGFLALILLGILFFSATSEALVDGVTRVFANESEILRAPIKKMIYDSSSNRLFAAATGNVIFRINPDTMMVTHTRTLSRAGSSSSSDEPVNLFINGIFLYYVARPFRATKPIWYSVLMSDLTGGNSGLFSDFETPRSLSACSDATRILLFSFATQTEYKYFNFDNGSFTGVGNFGSENREINSAGCYGSSETGILGWSYSSGDNAIQHLLLRPSGSNLDVYTVMSSPTVDNAQEGPFAGTTINIPPNRFYFPGDLFHHSFNGSHSVFMPYQSRVSAGSALIEFRIPVTSDLDSTRYSPTAVSFFPDDPDFSTVTVSSITNTSGVIFFGTSAGKVKKYRYQYTTFVGHLSSTKKAYNFSAAYSDDFLGEARNEVTASVLDKSTSPPRVFYASSATSGGIWKVPLYDCSTRTTCSSCLAMGDPFCGWCPLSGTCSDKAGCPTSALENGWLQGSQCPSITVRGDAGTTTFAGNNEFGIEIVPAFFPPPVEATKSSYSVEVLRSSGPPLAFSLFDVFAGPPKYIRGNLPVIEAPLANPFNESLSFSIYYNGILIATSENSATLYDCGYFQGCSSCLQASSTYECGWCTLDNKCTSNFGCIELSALPNAWNNGSSCPAIAKVSDANFPFDTPTSLSVVVSAIPDSASTGGSYTCRFTRELKGEMAEMNATVSIYSGDVPNAALVTCTTPEYGSNTLVSRDREEVTIAIWYTPDGDSAFELAAANPASKVLAFDCTTKTTCEQCVAQNFSCGWDARDGVCGTWELGMAKDAGGCPVITGIQPEHVSSSVPTTMTITGANLPAPSVRKRAGKEFYCLFSSGQKVVATWEDDTTLTCNTPVLFTDNTGVLANITLTILYGDEVLPSQASFPGVTFVSCTVFSESCILCTQESQTLGSVCGWCDGLSSCTPEASCNSSWAVTQNDCSGPTLSAPVPLTGPALGGTRIVISGNNLPDELVLVTIDSQPCSDHVWINTKTISCVTPPLNPGSYSIVAQFGDDSVTSDTQFSYVPNPQILSFAPAQGPISGGTEIVINGTNMDSGLNISLSIGTTPCQITQKTATEIRCTTPSVASASSSKLVLTIDLAEAESGDTFRFRANPAIIQFSPVEGPASAQFELVFQGTDLDLAVPTAIMADIGNGNITVTPTVIPGDLDSLSLKLPDCCGDRQIPDSGLFHRITFDFAGYTVQAPIYYKFYPNPKIDDFAPNEGAVEGGTVVFIEGSNLARGAEPTVTISGVPCNVTFASDVLVKCTTGPQEASDETGRLILTIGAASTMAVGSFAYKKTGLPTWVIPVIIAVSVAVLIAIVVGAVLYRRQVKKGRKRAAHLFAELDKANETSMNVLSEVMEAYTEYNTRGKFSNPLYNNKPIPLTPFDLFALETLFPRDESLSPPALINFSTQSKTLQDLKAFKQLMMKEEFAIIFFKTMESQPEFKLADRKYSAALFMIGLRTEIGHATNLLFSLLRDYISQKVRSGEQKTILRATSTVTEKLLTAWLAFTLHDFVSERLSKPLFALFMAIKSQIEKGAVDCVTGSSQYTLNASTILRQKVQYERIKIKAFLSDKSAEVEVNTCDSISQVVAAALFALDEPVKQNQYSLTDAEGRQLKDIDGTNDRDGEWIKVNTVAHYGLKEGSQIKLLKKNGQDSQATGTNLYHLEKKSEHDPDQKVAPSEVFFTRMMTMREFIRTQVDDLFTAIFDIKDEPPLPIKILFDFLDRTAKELGIEDPETVHIWKNNSLALRFWVNLVTNPNQLLGVTKTASVHNSFSTIGQVLMDSCSTSESKLGPGAPASKLLYKNEVDEYKGLVTRYYAHVHASPPIERPHIPIPQTTGDRLDENSAMSELQGYGKKFQAAVAEALEKAHKDELKSQFLASTPSS